MAALFTTQTLAVSLLLQRFAIPAGDQGVDVVGPIGLLLAGLAFYQGTLKVDRVRLILYFSIIIWMGISSSLRSIQPAAFHIPLSVSSYGQFLLLSFFCVFRFSESVDELFFFRRALTVFAVIAAAGIAQFSLQFIGVDLFSFSKFTPGSFSFEGGYNLVIPAGIGKLHKSNGFFLLEPSIFSQMMALGLIMEIVALKRLKYIVLFSLGLLLAFSGTGLIVLATFMVASVGKLGLRGMWLSLISAAAILTAILIAAHLAPDVVKAFTDRMGEFNQPGTSGYNRFHSPFLVVESAWERDGSVWLTGIGAGASRRLSLAFDFNSNTPIKILLDFGLPSLLLYTAMILSAHRTSLQSKLVLPSVILLFFAGSYEQFAPILFPIFLLICVARLHSSPPGATA